MTGKMSPQRLSAFQSPKGGEHHSEGEISVEPSATPVAESASDHKEEEEEEEEDTEYGDLHLLNIYTDFLLEDGGVQARAIAAYCESLKYDGETQEGTVSRRAVYNPLASSNSLSADPALANNPLRGRLIAMLTTTAILAFVFLQALQYNKQVTGSTLVPFSENGMLGPSGETLFDLGGLNTNAIRNEDGVYRIFWAAWMHSGWIHVFFNLICQIQFFFMFEPDWGFWRSFMIFFLSGITGNLLSAVADPCTTTVGSSGGLFGLMGAMIPYSIEFWKTIPRPGCILAFAVVVILISIVVGFTGNTDNWAHMGGLLGGLLVSFATITAMSAFDKIPKKPIVKKPTDTVKKVIHPARATRQLRKIAPDFVNGPREWFVRGSCVIGLKEAPHQDFQTPNGIASTNPLFQMAGITSTGANSATCLWRKSLPQTYRRSMLWDGVTSNQYPSSHDSVLIEVFDTRPAKKNFTQFLTEVAVSI